MQLSRLEGSGPTTMMAHKLVRVHGDEDWEAWGENWQSHADVVGDLAFMKDWDGAPAWLEDHPHREIVSDVWLYEASLEEVKSLIGERPHNPREDWDRPFREAEEHQNAMLGALPAGGRYGVVWIEVY